MAAFAAQSDLPIRDEGALAGRAREINCVGSGITCSVSGGIATFTSGSFAAGETLNFETAFAPIAITGGDSGNGDPALIIDDPTDEYLIVRFPHFVQFNLDGGGGVLGDFYIDGGTFLATGDSTFLGQINHNSSYLQAVTLDDALSAANYKLHTSGLTITETDLSATDAIFNTLVETIYGSGGAASSGTLNNLVSSVVIQGSNSADNEYTTLLSVLDARIGAGYAQTSGPVGRLWGKDFNLLGPIGVQPDLLNGITQAILNPYNGSPADSPSGGVWIITRPGTGGGIDATKAAATSYPIDVGLGIVGYSGASTTTSPSANGFTTGIQIGGHGSGWMPNTENSQIGTGIDISQYTTRGIYIHNPSGTPTADIEITGKGIFPDARITKIGNLTSNGVVHTGSSDGTLSIATVSNAELANMADSTIKGRAVGGGTGAPQDLTAAQTVAAIAPSAVALGSLLPNASFVGLQGQTGATGNLDLYTVPAGKRAFLTRVAFYNNGTGSTIPVFAEVKVSGTYYRLGATASVSNNGTNQAQAQSGPNFIFEPGDIVAINTATAAGITSSLGLVVFDNTAPLKGVRVLGPSSGDNTLYTCPVGKTAIAFGVDFLGSQGFTAPALTFVSDSGGARSWYWNAVASGGSPGATNKMQPAQSVSASAVTTSTVQPFWALSAGDFINVNVDTGNAAQIAFTVVLEM